MLADAGFVEWLKSLGGGDFRFAVLIVSASVVVILWSFAAAWRSVRQAEYRTRLTGALLQRGMRGDEIERVLRATYAEDGQSCESVPAIEPTDDPEVRIVKHLSKCSYDGNDIDKVLAAARENAPIDAGAVQMVEAMATQWTEADEIAQVLRNRPKNRPAHQPAVGQAYGRATPRGA